MLQPSLEWLKKCIHSYVAVENANIAKCKQVNLGEGSVGVLSTFLLLFSRFEFLSNRTQVAIFFSQRTL